MSKNIPRKISPMAQKAVKHYITQSEQLNNIAGGNETVKARREKAQQQLALQGFPTQKDEDWQYTKLTNFVQKCFKRFTKRTISHDEINHLLPPFDVTKIIFVDGWFNQALSDNLSALPSGVSIKSTHDILKTSGVTENLLKKEKQINATPFGLLNSLFLENGWHLQVTKNTTVDIPIFVLYVQTQADQMSNFRNSITLEENTELILIEQYVSLVKSDTDAGFTNVVTEMSIGKSAHMKQIILQQQNTASYYFNNQFINQTDNSNFQTFYAGIGSILSRHQNFLTLNGEHIECRQNSACLARGNQIVDSRTDTTHNQMWGTSQQLHKYVLDKNAIGVFNGMILVDQVAQKTDGQMDNKNLLLSPLAKMNCKPRLEIYADDVKCSHGSATGQINKEQIFYLQARGIARNQAVEMITKAFLMEPAEDISDSIIQKWLMKTLTTALNADSNPCHKTL